MLFKPAAFQQTLLKVLMDWIRPADGSTAAPLTWHAREAVLETTLSLGGLFASGVSLTGTLLAPHVCCSKRKPLRPSPKAPTGLFPSRMPPSKRHFPARLKNAAKRPDRADNCCRRGALQCRSRARKAFHQNAAKAWPGLSEGSLIWLVPEADSNNAVFFLTSLPPTATTLLRLKALVSRTPAPDTTASVFFLSEVVRGTNSAAVLNGEAVENLPQPSPATTTAGAKMPAMRSHLRPILQGFTAIPRKPCVPRRSI